MRIEVMRGHTKSLDANDKLMQTRSHVRNAIASRERQVVMRKVKSTIILSRSLERDQKQTFKTCQYSASRFFIRQVKSKHKFSGIKRQPNAIYG